MSTLPAIGSTVLEPETTVVDGKLAKVETSYTVVHAEAGMVLGKRLGKGKTVLLFAASAKAA